MFLHDKSLEVSPQVRSAQDHPKADATFGRTLRRGWQSAWIALAATAALAGALLGADAALARDNAPSTRERWGDTVALQALPAEAQTTYQHVLSGGPFPYEKDGVVFGNRERQLPAKARGYYREYTVKTPGSRDRGARRLVCGGEPPTKPDACYYTDDHYVSFSKITP